MAPLIPVTPSSPYHQWIPESRAQKLSPNKVISLSAKADERNSRWNLREDKKKPQRNERTKVPAFKSKNPILISHEKPNGNDKPLKEMRSF